MATIKIKGVITGKIGPVSIYETKYGTQVVRTYTKPRDPKTPKQLAHRMKFGLVNKGLSPLNEIIKRGFKGNSRTYRRQVGKAYHEAIIGEYPNFKLDYSKIKIAEGELQPLKEFIVNTNNKTGLVSFKWNRDIDPKLKTGNNRDKVNIVCLNEKEKVAIQYNNYGRRSIGEATIELPVGWQTDDTHFWAYLTSDFVEGMSIDLTINSDSIFQNPI